MTAVVGIDLSLTATGIAGVADDGRHETATIASTGRRADNLTQRSLRIHDIVNACVDFVDLWHPQLVVIEGPSVMSKGGSNWDRAWLWGAVVDALPTSKVAICPPAVLKKWAAGKGNADKAAVAVGVARLWPAFECASDNEADALGLATMGAQRLGLEIAPCRAHHPDWLLKVEWPLSLLTAQDLAAIAEDRIAELTQDAASGMENQ